jgi:hypothetical protein
MKTVEYVRQSTAAAAGKPIDLSYITESFIEQTQGAAYATDEGQKHTGEEADAIIRTYGGEPSNGLRVYYGTDVAQILDTWFMRMVNYDNGTWTVQSPQIVRGATQQAKIVGSCSNGSPLWEFRI